jgi:hypothetical protein
MGLSRLLSVQKVVWQDTAAFNTLLFQFHNSSARHSSSVTSVLTQLHKQDYLEQCMFATPVPATHVAAAVVVLLTTTAAVAAVCKVVVSEVQAGVEAVVASVHCVSVAHATCYWRLVARQHLMLLELLELLLYVRRSKNDAEHRTVVSNGR